MFTFLSELLSLDLSLLFIFIVPDFFEFGGFAGDLFFYFCISFVLFDLSHLFMNLGIFFFFLILYYH